MLIKAERKMLFAAATAISALGFVTLPAAAHADPPIPVPPNCNNQFLFSTVDIDVTQDNGIDVFPATDQGGTNVAGPAYYLSGPARTKTNGSVVGGMNENFIDFTANWDNGDTNHYTGHINADGSMSGTTVNNKNVSNGWRSGAGSLKCAKPAAAAPAPANNPAPPPQASAPPVNTPPQGPTVSANPGALGVTFHVTDRSGVASNCSYSSEGFTSDSFSLPANGSFDLFVPAVREFRTRTGTVTCDNGTSAPTSVVF